MDDNTQGNLLREGVIKRMHGIAAIFSLIGFGFFFIGSIEARTPVEIQQYIYKSSALGAFTALNIFAIFYWGWDTAKAKILSKCLALIMLLGFPIGTFLGLIILIKVNQHTIPEKIKSRPINH